MNVKLELEMLFDKRHNYEEEVGELDFHIYEMEQSYPDEYVLEILRNIRKEIIYKLDDMYK